MKLKTITESTRTIITLIVSYIILFGFFYFLIVSYWDNCKNNPNRKIVCRDCGDEIHCHCESK